MNRWTRKARSLAEGILAPIVGVTIGVRTDVPVVSLTFDDGPDPVTTPAVLDLLAAYGARATFFVIGEQAASNRELLDRIRAGGHAVGNHTWSHPSLPRLDRSERRHELRKTTAVLGRSSSTLMRPPYGHFDLATWFDVTSLGMRPVTWTAHAEDWRTRNPDRMLDRMRAGTKPGAILLLHDRLHDLEPGGESSRDAMLQALERYLAEVAPHVGFVTVPELLEYGPARRRTWWKRGDDAWLEQLRPA